MKANCFAIFIVFFILTNSSFSSSKWEEFKYNSQQEKLFWGNLKDWTFIESISLKRRDSEGHEIVPSSQNAYSGYAKKAHKEKRTIYLLKDGWVSRSMSWFRNGYVAEEMQFLNGILHGPQKIWYTNGKIKTEQFWDYGKQDGILKEWYSNGQIAMEASFEGGLYSGKKTTWYKSGIKKEESHWKMGKINRSKKLWTAMGKKRITHFFMNPRLSLIIFDFFHSQGRKDEMFKNLYISKWKKACTHSETLNPIIIKGIKGKHFINKKSSNDFNNIIFAQTATAIHSHTSIISSDSMRNFIREGVSFPNPKQLSRGKAPKNINRLRRRHQGRRNS